MACMYLLAFTCFRVLACLHLLHISLVYWHACTRLPVLACACLCLLALECLLVLAFVYWLLWSSVFYPDCTYLIPLTAAQPVRLHEKTQDVVGKSYAALCDSWRITTQDENKIRMQWKCASWSADVLDFVHQSIDTISFGDATFFEINAVQDCNNRSSTWRSRLAGFMQNCTLLTCLWFRSQVQLDSVLDSSSS